MKREQKRKIEFDRLKKRKKSKSRLSEKLRKDQKFLQLYKTIVFLKMERRHFYY